MNPHLNNCIKLFVAIITVVIVLSLVFISFCNTENIKDKLVMLGNAGNFLIGLAALLAVFWSKEHIDNRRPEAASKILSLFRECIADISLIIETPELYMYDGYNPFSSPEISNKETKPHSERPPRLVYNKIGKLNKELIEPLSKIMGNESVKLNTKAEELEKMCREICSWLWTQLSNQTDKDTILKPIIED